VRYPLLAAILAVAAFARAQTVDVHFGGNPPTLVKRVDPVYPKSALSIRMQGVVRLSVVVGADGRFLRAESVSGEPRFVEAVLAAVKQWVFTPPVAGTFPVDVSFNLDQKNDGPDRPDHLVKAGEELDSDDALDLERVLARKPNDKTARAKLLGFYTVNKRIAERRKTLAWFVSRDPSSVALSTDDALLLRRGNSLADPEGYALVKSLWLKCAEAKLPGREAWDNAVQFLSWQDKPEAEKILLELGKHRMSVNVPASLPAQMRDLLERGANEIFTRQLGWLYAKAVMGLVATDDSGKPVFDREEANNDFARHAMAVLESSSSDGILGGAEQAFLTYNEEENGKWNAILAQIQKSRGARR